MTKVNCSIDVHHLTRVEGHGNIHIDIRNGELVDAKWAVVETPRFFEVMVKTMSPARVPFLTSRICGICSISHSLASIRSLERAMEISPPPAAEKLRLLAMHGETLQSHALHIFFLAVPDFVDTPSVIPLVESHPHIVQAGLRLKAAGNAISELVTGRCTHPVSLVLGGVSKAPDKEKLEALRAQLDAVRADLDTTAEFCSTLQIPSFVRETEFVSLRNGNTYPAIGGDLVSTDGVRRDENDYLAMTNEYKPEFTTTKFTRLSRGSFAAGALARFNNNVDLLRPEAVSVARQFGLEPVNHNPFMNNIAQLVECVHIVHDAIDLIDDLLDDPLNELKTPWKPKEGAATGAVEAPRGILYHHMEVDRHGTVCRGDCIIPTTQNNANIHHDLAALARQAADEGKDDQEIRQLCEMLVRAYDPCISCSVH
ncbi:Ni/Fe hydrogenase subunit alpha [Prosthecochloris sp. ZM_2]|uniref:Ni/Fe hydrogenase subunit alpha n=1 Tax=Prosthecochloris sp. ZM_2 TaxID=2045206 RepID=UPI000DF733BA|nr:Ni/Fe hydrogenase subunit alpha [Prosthecochloris sp. ZM_2]RNA65449.1 Ni/Fe hydrogenase subunit alpha [Prosthecochloris sp. ZM_2]